MTLQKENIQLAVWAAAILLFGFGDTFTSLMVFQNGGREANAVLAFAFQVLGPTLWTFLLIKLAAITLVVAIARRPPGIEGYVRFAMLFLGLFLVVNNTTVLAAT